MQSSSKNQLNRAHPYMEVCECSFSSSKEHTTCPHETMKVYIRSHSISLKKKEPTCLPAFTNKCYHWGLLLAQDALIMLSTKLIKSIYADIHDLILHERQRRESGVHAYQKDGNFELQKFDKRCFQVAFAVIHAIKVAQIY